MTTRLQQVLLAILLGSLITAFAEEQPDEQSIRGYKQDNADSHTRSVQIAGRWFSDQSLLDGGRRLALCERFADGTFVVTFRIMQPDGVVKESTEVGEWGTSGPVYFTITKGWIDHGKFIPATGNAYFYDAYEILQLGTGAFVYRHYEMGDTYRNRRVGSEFKMPELTGS
jgi:hypothetical protein